MSDDQLAGSASRGAPGDAPLVSIVIPTYARPEQLRACLAGVSDLQFDDTFEVIVVDDGNVRPIEDVLSDFVPRLNIRVIRQERSGPGSARNAGSAIARGRFLAFIDDDCVPASNWLGALTRELRANEDTLLGGRVVNALSRNPYADASDRVSRFVYDYYRSTVTPERFFTTNNMALSAARFRELGGFTTRIPSRTAEDKEFCDRWIARGLTLHSVADAVVYHNHDLTFRRFLRQHFNYGRGILAFRLMRRGRGKSRLVPEPLSFYAGLVISPLRDGAGTGRWSALFLLATSQVATIAGALHQAVTWRSARKPSGS